MPVPQRDTEELSPQIRSHGRPYLSFASPTRASNPIALPAAQERHNDPPQDAGARRSACLVLVAQECEGWSAASGGLPPLPTKKSVSVFAHSRGRCRCRTYTSLHVGVEPTRPYTNLHDHTRPYIHLHDPTSATICHHMPPCRCFAHTCHHMPPCRCMCAYIPHMPPCRCMVAYMR